MLTVCYNSLPCLYLHYWICDIGDYPPIRSTISIPTEYLNFMFVKKEHVILKYLPLLTNKKKLFFVLLVLLLVVWYWWLPSNCGKIEKVWVEKVKIIRSGKSRVSWVFLRFLYPYTFFSSACNFVLRCYLICLIKLWKNAIRISVLYPERCRRKLHLRHFYGKRWGRRNQVFYFCILIISSGLKTLPSAMLW